ncbi:5572_t:CDS:2 [Cetraspora pellucida]|uniref:5572_t:CDS:1 n=1 Tax=Cetraspora pellucida TaxID=1433469 RepID=A0ACA9K4F8_9GLOM|nr:5572_t:CDS:2 [Cetraspora pellucida]
MKCFDISVQFYIFLSILVAFIYTLPIPQSPPVFGNLTLSPNASCYSVGQSVTANWNAEPGTSGINVKLTVAGVVSNVTYYVFTDPWQKQSETFTITSEMLLETLCKASLSYAEGSPTFLLGVVSFSICKS